MSIISLASNTGSFVSNIQNTVTDGYEPSWLAHLPDVERGSVLRNMSFKRYSKSETIRRSGETVNAWLGVVPMRSMTDCKSVQS